MRANGNPGTRHVAVIGTGGAIGSNLVPHLARMPALGRLTLIDRDRYEARNVANQAVTDSAVGRMKALVQAHVARTINPRLAVTAVCEDVEHVPLGRLRADLILSCLDSRRSRQYVNQAALRLGVPWLDAGVLADGHLARIDLYRPGTDTPCLECGWDVHDYAALEQAYPCDGGNGGSVPAPTAAPSALGAFAASLQALECSKVLNGEDDTALPPGTQIVIGISPHCHYITRQRRNPACHLGEHAAWEITPITVTLRTTSMKAVIRTIAARLGDAADISFCVDGRTFATGLECRSCGHTRETLRLLSHAGSVEASCHSCASNMSVPLAGMRSCIDPVALSPPMLRRTLQSVGIRAGDVVTARRCGEELHVEIREGGLDDVDHLSANGVAP